MSMYANALQQHIFHEAIVEYDAHSMKSAEEPQFGMASKLPGVLGVQAFFVDSCYSAIDSLLFEMKWGESNPLYCLKSVFLVIRGCSLAASFLTSLLFHVTSVR